MVELSSWRDTLKMVTDKSKRSVRIDFKYQDWLEISNSLAEALEIDIAKIDWLLPAVSGHSWPQAAHVANVTIELSSQTNEQYFDWAIKTLPDGSFSPGLPNPDYYKLVISRVVGPRQAAWAVHGAILMALQEQASVEITPMGLGLTDDPDPNWLYDQDGHYIREILGGIFDLTDYEILQVRTGNRELTVYFGNAPMLLHRHEDAEGQPLMLTALPPEE